MKHFLTSLAALALGVTSLFAQVGEQRPDRPLYIAVQGGAMYSVSENEFSYRNNDKTKDLITGHGSFSVGYDFGTRAGARLNVSYGKNASAANVNETNGNHPVTGLHFFPYTFKNISAFADFTWNIAKTGSESAFVPKVYAGVGFAHTYDFTDPKHPWQSVTDPNNVFGFRFGFIGEYKFTDCIGAFVDVAGEAYTDYFNGLRPTKEEQKANGKGYLGFPLDLRAMLSFGLAFHF